MKDKHVAIEVSRDEHYRTPYLKSLKENWPSLAKDYRHYCHTYSPGTGELWTWTSPEGQMFFHLVLDDCSNDQPLHLVNANISYAVCAHVNSKDQMCGMAGAREGWCGQHWTTPAAVAAFDTDLYSFASDAQASATGTASVGSTPFVMKAGLDADVNNVPEPGTLLLLSVALLGAGVARRRMAA